MHGAVRSVSGPCWAQQALRPVRSSSTRPRMLRRRPMRHARRGQATAASDGRGSHTCMRRAALLQQRGSPERPGCSGRPRLCKRAVAEACRPPARHAAWAGARRCARARRWRTSWTSGRWCTWTMRRAGPRTRAAAPCSARSRAPRPICCSQRRSPGLLFGKISCASPGHAAAPSAGRLALLFGRFPCAPASAAQSIGRPALRRSSVLTEAARAPGAACHRSLV